MRLVVSAAPIDVIARLNPGQSGPVYAWSLMVRVDPGCDVGAVQVRRNAFETDLSNHPLALVSLTLVPDPSHFALFAVVWLGFVALRALETRAVGATELEAAPLE